MLRTYTLSTRVTAAVGWLGDTFAERIASYGRRGVVVLGRGRAVDSARRQEIVERLRQAALDPVLCEGIGPDGHLQALRAAARQIPDNADWFLAVGGGSVIDAAKLLAFHRNGKLLLVGTESVADLTNQLNTAHRRPVIALPTCLGSGAEVSALSELIDDRGWKEPVVDARLAPDEAWIDPAFVAPPPPAIQAAAIVDLFFNLFDPLVNRGDRASPEDSIAIELCRQLVSLVARVPDLRFMGEEALKLAWLGHLAVQPGLSRPRSASVLHRIEHVISPALGCAHGEGLAWLAGAFLRRAVERGPEVARQLVDLTAAIFGGDASPDCAVERWLERLPLIRPKPLVYGDGCILAARVLEAYGQAGRLPGPFAFGAADIETILEDGVKTAGDPGRLLAEPIVESHPVNATRVFGGPVDGTWDWLLLTPLPFVEDDLEAWRERWTRGWYPTLRIEGAQHGLVVRSSPGGDIALDGLELLVRAGACFRSIHVVGLCGALRLDWPVGTCVRPSAVWGDRRQRERCGVQPIPLWRLGEADSFVHSGICGSVSTLATETTDLLQAWKSCGVDVVDLETFAVASFGQRMGIPVSADLVISDHPLDGVPLWSSGALLLTVRKRAVDLVARYLDAACCPERSSPPEYPHVGVHATLVPRGVADHE